MNILYLVIGLAVGGAGIYGYFHMEGGKRLKKIEADNDRKIAKIEKHLRDLENKASNAEHKLKEKVLDAKNKALDIINDAKKEEMERRKQINKQEQRLISKEDLLEKKGAEVEKIKGDHLKKLEQMKVREEKLDALFDEQKEALSKITKMTKEEAREMLLKNVEREYKDELVERYKQIEVNAREDAQKKAKDVIVHAIQKMAANITSESTQTLVQLPGDDIKGRVIGREGRNINAFEHVTGVDVIVDDTPGAIVISGFDLVRRYVAKRSLEKLVEDGRIHPARIESVVEETKTEVNNMMSEFGEKAVQEMGIVGLHPDLIKIIGRLRFRTSYGQNVLKHSMEVGFIAASIASQLGMDIQMAKMGGFLHDIGKAVDHDIEGSHALIGRDIAKKYGLPEPVVNAIAAHHEEEPFGSAEAIIVQAADAISAARPGARRETLETYIKRLKELEALTNSFNGVEKSYAIQAGREVRVMVKPDEVDDMQAIELSHQIARKIEQELSYPGTIKVQVLRETRSVDVAR